jgi:hypothetical protein
MKEEGSAMEPPSNYLVCLRPAGPPMSPGRDRGP